MLATYQAFPCFVFVFSLLYCSAFFTLQVLAALQRLSSFPFLVLVSLVFLCCLAVWFLTFCSLPVFLSALPSGNCSPIVDNARLLEYSSALPSIYRFAICLTQPVFLTMPHNKSLHMDLHASRLVGTVTVTFSWCQILYILEMLINYF